MYSWEAYQKVQTEESIIDGRKAAMELAEMSTCATEVASKEKTNGNAAMGKTNIAAELLNANSNVTEQGQLKSLPNNKNPLKPVTSKESSEVSKLQNTNEIYNGNTSDQSNAVPCTEVLITDKLINCKCCMSLLKVRIV